MKRKSISLIFAAILFACTSRNEIAQWRGPERNGIYPEKNLLTQWPDSGPKLLWRFDSLGTGYSSAAVTSERVYTIGTIDSISYVFTFNKRGELLWKKKLGKDWTKNWIGIRSTPTIYKGFGYVLNGIGVLYCFDVEKGDIIWEKNILKEYNGRNLEFGLCENLVVDDDKLFCTPAGLETTVVALNRITGDLLWKSNVKSDSSSYSNPILIQIGNEKYFINQTQKTLFALNAENGELAWTFKMKSKWHPNTSIFKNGYLFAVDGAAGSIMLKINEDGKSVKEVWTNRVLSPVQGDAVLIGEQLFGLGDKGKKFVCVDWNTGKEIFYDSANNKDIAVVSAENLLYCYELAGAVNLLKPTEKGFEKSGSFQVRGGNKKLHCSHPVINDGRLYIRHDNSLFVYDIAKR